MQIDINFVGDFLGDRFGEIKSRLIDSVWNLMTVKNS
jgi:hypothetical protein